MRPGDSRSQPPRGPDRVITQLTAPTPCPPRDASAGTGRPVSPRSPRPDAAVSGSTPPGTHHRAHSRRARRGRRSADTRSDPATRGPRCAHHPLGPTRPADSLHPGPPGGGRRGGRRHRRRTPPLASCSAVRPPATPTSRPPTSRHRRPPTQPRTTHEPVAPRGEPACRSAGRSTFSLAGRGHPPGRDRHPSIDVCPAAKKVRRLTVTRIGVGSCMARAVPAGCGPAVQLLPPCPLSDADSMRSQRLRLQRRRRRSRRVLRPHQRMFDTARVLTPALPASIDHRLRRG